MFIKHDAHVSHCICLAHWAGSQDSLHGAVLKLSLSPNVLQTWARPWTQARLYVFGTHFPSSHLVVHNFKADGLELQRIKGSDVEEGFQRSVFQLLTIMTLSEHDILEAFDFNSTPT